MLLLSFSDQNAANFNRYILSDIKYIRDQIRPVLVDPFSLRSRGAAKRWLDYDEVHVWRANLDLPESTLIGFMRSLAPEERARAERYRQEVDRKRFIAGRGLLRKLLSCYLDERPEEIRFSYGPFGKPALVTGAGDPFLTFNVANSGGLGFFALASGRAVGIDVELIPSEVVCREIADYFFTPEECRLWRSLPRDRQPEAFGTCWTQKEAYLKARGVGFSVSPDKCRISFLPNESDGLVVIWEDLEPASPWSLIPLVAGPGYTAALAAEGRGWRLLNMPEAPEGGNHG